MHNCGRMVKWWREGWCHSQEPRVLFHSFPHARSAAPNDVWHSAGNWFFSKRVLTIMVGLSVFAFFYFNSGIHLSANEKVWLKKKQLLSSKFTISQDIKCILYLQLSTAQFVHCAALLKALPESHIHLKRQSTGCTQHQKSCSSPEQTAGDSPQNNLSLSSDHHAQTSIIYMVTYTVFSQCYISYT